MIKDKKIAVTGSAGFIGSHLVKRLSGIEAEIIPLDIREGMDITDWDHCRSVRKFDVLFHLAAKIFVPDAFQNPRDFYHMNINGTVNALELCRVRGAKMVFISSYVYGNPEYLPIDENHPVVAFNPYAESKIIGEQLCQGFHRDFQIPVVILRPFNIFGYGQNENFLIPSIIKQAQSGEIFLKDPEPRRDLIYIDDVIDACIKTIDYDHSSFDVFNIGSGKSHSVREIVAMITKNFEHEVRVEFSGEQRTHEVMDTIADISKSEKLLGWKPVTDIEHGIEKITTVK